MLVRCFCGNTYFTGPPANLRLDLYDLRLIINGLKACRFLSKNASYGYLFNIDGRSLQ